MRILVTNDDGVHAPGIAELARSLEADGHDVLVVAPLEDRSGSGAGFGAIHLGTDVPYQEVEIPGLAAPAIGLDGLPALAVMVARLGAFGPPPEVVVSGINPGPNTGRSVLHSGTVGAALAAANLGVSGLAVSMGVGELMHWATSGAVAAAALRWLVEAPARTVLNVNVPNRPPAALEGVRAARLAPFGTVRTAVVESAAGRLQLELRDHGARLDPDTDTALVEAGWVAVTPLVGVSVATSVDGAALEAALSAALPQKARTA